MRMTVLGCGGAGGVPLIGDQWGACDPSNPKNRRRRVSILVEDGATRLLVDTSPDLRLQLLDAGVDDLDGVLYTHIHADHVHGIDELRVINRLHRKVLDIYGDAKTLETLRDRFAYVFTPPMKKGGEFRYFKPCLEGHEITSGKAFSAGGIDVLPFEQDHGFMPSMGYRFGDMAYSTDVAELPEAAFTALKDVKIWVVSCLRLEPHPTHAHLDRVLGWIERVKPERAVLTHMSLTLDYDELAKLLPPGVEPAHDGLVLECP